MYTFFLPFAIHILKALQFDVQKLAELLKLESGDHSKSPKSIITLPSLRRISLSPPPAQQPFLTPGPLFTFTIRRSRPRRTPVHLSRKVLSISSNTISWKINMNYTDKCIIDTHATNSNSLQPFALPPFTRTLSIAQYEELLYPLFRASHTRSIKPP